MIEMNDGLKRQIPEPVLLKMEKMDEFTQETFLAEFKKKKKSPLVAFILLLLLPPFHYFYFGKVWLNLLLWLTLCIGIGFIWWFVDLFRIFGMVREYNRTVAIHMLRDIQILN